MSNLEDLREAFGVYDCEDHDVIDAILDKIFAQERTGEEHYLIKKGREVHRITLSKNVPATVLKVELNTPLDEDVCLTKFNELDSAESRNPGSWFVQQGFTVRSKNEDGHWVQYAFKSNGANNLTRSEIMEYLGIAGLSCIPNQIEETGPIVVSRS
ncbi:hypothetical protein FDP08_12850 [Marinobacter panjinensis]|uniref:Uncharacterized protein n=1 Tax=Marinobacter panjinensis TaxID=2576384 RepID=A0A4V6CUF6_9GAMM|nr:hypothetical protein [Marinobacter panjinensis]MCR8914233.1 hypothetical protein [Marinobacter panjinensis]TKV68915.1 hypothetical protein FDP08_12850 [Marinobacter panjinensis]